MLECCSSKNKIGKNQLKIALSGLYSGKDEVRMGHTQN